MVAELRKRRNTWNSSTKHKYHTPLVGLFDSNRLPVHNSIWKVEAVAKESKMPSVALPSNQLPYTSLRHQSWYDRSERDFKYFCGDEVLDVCSY